MRILCIDDDNDTRLLLENLLGFSNLEAIAVRDAESALKMMQTENFSLYIIDDQLPGVSGRTMCEEIRKHDKTTPIIIFSGHAFDSDQQAGLSAGANVYLIKPDSSAIVPTVKRLLLEASRAE